MAKGGRVPQLAPRSVKSRPSRHTLRLSDREGGGPVTDGHGRPEASLADIAVPAPQRGHIQRWLERTDPWTTRVGVLLPRPLAARQDGALDPRRELHRVPARGRCMSRTASSPGRRSRPIIRRTVPTCPSTSRAAARAMLRSPPGTRTPRCASATPTFGASCSRCIARPSRAPGKPASGSAPRSTLIPGSTPWAARYSEMGTPPDVDCRIVSSKRM